MEEVVSERISPFHKITRRALRVCECLQTRKRNARGSAPYLEAVKNATRLGRVIPNTEELAQARIERFTRNP